MPEYPFEHRPSGSRITRDFPVGKAPKTIRVNGRVYRRVLAAIAFVVPNHMKAAGHKDSSEDANDRQTAYLRSDKWRKERERIDSAGGNVRYGSDCKDD